MRPGIALRPYQHRDAVIDPAQAFQALLAVSLAGVLFRQHGRVEQTGARCKVNAVLGEIGDALGFVVGNHRQIVLTPSGMHSIAGRACPTTISA